jgi:hypothetical protein
MSETEAFFYFEPSIHFTLIGHETATDDEYFLVAAKVMALLMKAQEKPADLREIFRVEYE